MKRVAETEHDLVVEIPFVARIGPIRVEPPLTVVVPLDVEDVQVAIGVRPVRGTFCSTTL